MTITTQAQQKALSLKNQLIKPFFYRSLQFPALLNRLLPAQQKIPIIDSRNTRLKGSNQNIQRTECQIAVIQRTGQSRQIPSFSQWIEYHRMVQAETPKDKVNDKTAYQTLNKSGQRLLETIGNVSQRFSIFAVTNKPLSYRSLLHVWYCGK